MYISSFVKKALYFAAQKHDGQYRKGDGHVPYIVHPVQVAFNASTYTDDEKIIAAALLHDVLEDCKEVSFDLLQKEFGIRTAELVDEVSFIENKKYTTWKEKKQDYLKKIKHASKDALIIVAADKTSNLRAYFDALKENGDSLVKNFGGTPDEYFWYYGEIGNILISVLGDHPIVKDYTETLQSYQNENL